MVRLRRVSPGEDPGIMRVRSGDGFRYRTTAGGPVRTKDIDRIRALVIPPAWDEVWICADARGHIQAVGTDAAGRRQYLYHPGWSAPRDRGKYQRALSLAAALPRARARVTAALRKEEDSRERTLAAAFRLLDAGALRVGSRRYAARGGGRGLTTLQRQDATIEGTVVTLDFPAKSGQPWESEIVDPDLAVVVARLKRRGGRARLLAWHDDARGWRPLSAEDINADVRARTGGDFTAKDFRTLHGTVTAAVSLARSGPGETAAARKRAVVQAVRLAADALGNTPAVARSSYIDPRLLDRYARGETIDVTRPRAAEAALRELLTG